MTILARHRLDVIVVRANDFMQFVEGEGCPRPVGESTLPRAHLLPSPFFLLAAGVVVLYVSGDY